MSRTLAAILLAAVWSSQTATGEGTTNTVALPSGLEPVLLDGVPLAPEFLRLQPGDEVRVLAVYLDPVIGQTCTTVVEETALLLAVTRSNQAMVGSVTLAVRPDLAETLVAASRAKCLRIAPTDVGVGSENLVYRNRSPEDWRALALAHLTKRYPNIRPDEFVYQRAILDRHWRTSVTLVFADRASRYPRPASDRPSRQRP